MNPEIRKTLNPKEGKLQVCLKEAVVDRHLRCLFCADVTKRHRVDGLGFRDQVCVLEVQENCAGVSWFFYRA